MVSERAGLRVGMLGLEAHGRHPGGMNRYAEELRAALSGLGAEVSLLVLGPLPEIPERDMLSAGRAGDPAITKWIRYWRAARRLCRVVDVVDVHFALSALLPVLLGSLSDKALVVHFQGPWAEETAFERGKGETLADRLRHGAERIVYRRARELVVLSAAFRDILVDSYEVDPGRVHVIPPGVDLERFTPDGREQARAALGIASDERVVLAVRRHVRRMGLDVLLDAWPIPSKETPRRTLVVAGDGPLRGELEERAARLGMRGQVRFVGLLDEDELARWYRAADCSVVPSRSLEGFGMTVLESLASGTPVIASDVGGLAEALRDLDPSLLVPPDDAVALGQRLDAALSADALPSRADCRHLAGRFRWDEVARRTLEIYRRAGGRSGRPLRVVYLDHHAQLSGGELALLRLLPALVGRVEPLVILGADGPLAERLENQGIPVEILPIGDLGSKRRAALRGPDLVLAGAASAAYCFRLASRLRSLRPDLVHTNTLKAALYGSPAAKLAGVPVVLHLRDRLATDYLPSHLVTISRRAGFLADAVIANSKATLATLPVRGTRPRAVIPSPIAPSPPRVRRADGPLAVGMIGRLAPWKGQHVFLDAFARAFPFPSEVKAVVVGAALFGEEGYAASLRVRARELGIASRVEFRGFQEDVAAELGRLDILVHASVLPEPFGQVVVEGMSAGIPVVAADAGGPAEVITDGVDGLLLPPGDVGALAAALVRLSEDDMLRDRLGTAGRATSLRYDAPSLSAQTYELYRHVLEPRTSGA